MKQTFSLLLFLLFWTSAIGQTITQSGSICADGKVLLSVADAPANAAYQWTRNSTPIAGATQASYSATTYGSYGVQLTTGGSNQNPDPVTLCDKPTVTLTVPLSVCLGSDLEPTANVNACGGGTLQYAWTFEGGSPASANTADPGAITYASTGTYRIKLSVTNSCGTTTREQEVAVVEGRPEAITPPNGTIICEGTDTTLRFTSPTPGTTFSWRRERDDIGMAVSGTGDSIRFTAKNETNRLLISQVEVTPRNGCGTGTKVLFNLYIPNRPALTNYNIKESQTICKGTAPALLEGETPAGTTSAYTYQWQQSEDGNAWTYIPEAAEKDYQPPVLEKSTFFRRILKNDFCGYYSDVVEIKVVEPPKAKPQADILVCNNTQVPVVAFEAIPSGNVVYNWTNTNTGIGLAASGSGNLPAFTAANNTRTPLTAQIMVIPLLQDGPVQCAGEAMQFNIVTLPQVSTQAIADVAVCAGANVAALTPKHDAGNTSGSTVAFSWEVSGASVGLENGSGTTIPAFTTPTNITAPQSATVTVTPLYSYEGKTCSGTPVSYTITVNPATPAANAGPDAALCATATYTMKAANPPSGTTGKWTQTEGPAAIITTPASPTSTINDLKAGNTYRFEWSLTGGASCAATKDVVIIAVSANLVNTIPTTKVVTCSNSPITINAPAATGGGGNYSYQWQFSTNGTTWEPIAGQKSKDLSFTAPSPGFVSRMVVSGNCTNVSAAAAIEFQNAITNNTITGDQAVCAGTKPTVITGSTPQGSDANSRYQWQQSTDNGNSWQTIANAAGKDITPGQLSQTTLFRRQVVYLLCGGTQTDNSNTVTLTVNGPAKAAFTYTRDEGCAPFQLQPTAIQATDVPASNSAYEWYANGNLIGTGLAFPGYTITEPETTVAIKLKAISKWGCDNDSLVHDFKALGKPAADIVYRPEGNCGTGTFYFSSNTSSPGLTYAWNFGDGKKAEGPEVKHSYTQAGTYSVNMSVTNQAGCTTTVSREVAASIDTRPTITIKGEDAACANTQQVFRSNIQSASPIQFMEWILPDGSKTNTPEVTYRFAEQGTYEISLVAGSSAGCTDTATHTIAIETAPGVSAGADVEACAGSPVQLQASGAAQYSWSPAAGLSCTGCANPQATVNTNTTFVVTGSTVNGCSNTDTVRVTVVQPIRVAISGRDSICIGQPATLQASGASSYQWLELSSSGATINVTPSATTTYQVVGRDSRGCFKDTASFTVAVGMQPAIDLGPDLSLASGTTQQLNATVQNGPVGQWQWFPARNLSCTNCPAPLLQVTEDITYIVTGTSDFGCVAADTLSIRLTSETAKVFIPNAFTPDGDGLNDRLIVRGQGIALVKSFRIYNRYGNVVFEKRNFKANDAGSAWDGKTKGIAGPTETYVYSVEVLDEKGKTHLVKGTVTVVR